MAELLKVTVDLSEAGLGLAASDLEVRSLTLADELRLGRLAESARLARQEDLPEGAKAGLLAFVGGVLTAEISRENLKKTMDFLGNQFYGKTLTLAYKGDGLECSLEYRNPAEMEQALAAVERLEAVRIKVMDKADG
jgi:hypothetical protein